MLEQIISVKRWQWLVIAAVLGGAAAYIAVPKSPDLRADYGEARNGQADFETALLRDIEGHRQFRNILVHRQSVAEADGGERAAWIVTGLYCSGTPDPSDGKLHWKPTFFVAPEPYRPARDSSQLLGSAGPSAAGHFRQTETPTVLDFLRVVSETSGVRYTHAWWRTYAVTTWLIGSIVLIGLVWPTAIDLIVFGRFIRPRAAKVAEAAHSSSPAPAAKAEPSAEEKQKLEALNAAIEASLLAGATDTGGVTAVATTSSAIKKLTAEAPAQPGTTVKPSRAFGAGAGDYYPTEQKAKTPVGKKGGT
jgi:hypothetical protein